MDRRRPRRAGITRRDFLERSAMLGAGAIAGSLVSCDDRSPGPFARPNVVLILSDQHRADALGASGHPVVRTPNLDRIAAEGVRFGRCYCNAPLCRPSRASLMSGLYPREHGVWTNGYAADQHGPSHVRRLRDEAGYRTATIGKSHLHLGEGHLEDYRDILVNWGFDHTHELVGPGQSTEIRSRYTDWLTESTPEGEGDKYARFQNYQITQFDDHWESPWGLSAPDETPWRLSASDHLDRYTGRAAAQWIRERGGDGPFYLQVGFPGPHNPFDATTGYRGMYDPADPSMPPGVLVHPEDPVSYPVGYAREFQDVTSMTEEQHRLLQALYYAKVSMVDEGIGNVLDALDETGRLDDTWVVYTSDHGELLGDHYLVGKIAFYEGAVRVPLIVRPPGGVAGRTSDGMVELLDLTATLLDIGGLDPGVCHGGSLIDAVEGGPGAAPSREWVVSENYLHGMIRTDRYKLVADYRWGHTVELYDLEEDPDETANLRDDPDLEHVRQELSSILLDGGPIRS